MTARMLENYVVCWKFSYLIGVQGSICVSIILMYFFIKETNHLFELFKCKPKNTKQVTDETTQECS